MISRASTPVIAGGASLSQGGATSGAAASSTAPVLAVLAGPALATSVPVRRRDVTVADRLLQTGLHAPLGERADAWLSEPPAHERALAEDMLSVVRERAKRRNLSDSRLGTALGLVEDYAAAFPHRILFLPLGGADELMHAVHNEETLAMMGEFKLRQGSLQPGRVGQRVRAQTVSGYISKIRVERGLGAGYAIAHSRVVNLGKMAMTQVRHTEGRKATRALRRGWRAQHFLRAFAAGFDVRSPRGIRRWARMLVGHNFLLRGGEVGTVDERPWDGELGMMSLESVRFYSCAELQVGGRPSDFPAIRFMLSPVKDTYAKLEPVPNWVRRRQPADIPRGSDPLCAYDAFLSYWEQECADVPRGEWATTPLFRDDLGEAVRSQVVRVDCRAAAVAAGFSPEEFGASSLRIGGAEDIYDRYGERADAVIRERGRWWTDIHTIYQRASLSRHLAVSAEMGESCGLSLEAFADGWAMPGR